MCAVRSLAELTVQAGKLVGEPADVRFGVAGWLQSASGHQPPAGLQSPISHRVGLQLTAGEVLACQMAPGLQWKVFGEQLAG